MGNKVLAPELLIMAEKIARQAGELLLNRPQAFEVTSKSVAIDIATQMDHDSEKFIVESLLSFRGSDGIIGEEGSERPSTSGITWVIDPVDGTVNYLYGLPGWSVSIAAKDEEGVLVGVVHAPTIGSTWTAIRGGGAYCNGIAIRCNDPVPLDRALIGTGFVYDVSMRPQQGKVVAALLPRVRDIRRMGSAAVDICFVATGGLDGYFEIGLKEWDLAAAHLIASEAGARIHTDSDDLTSCAGPSLFALLGRALEAAK